MKARGSQWRMLWRKSPRRPDNSIAPESQNLGELDFELKAIPPTYAPPRPPPGGKLLTNRQRLALAATILVTVLIVVLLGLFLQHRLWPFSSARKWNLLRR